MEAALAVAKEPADADLIKNVNEILAGCYEGGEEWEKLAKLSEDMAEKKPEEAAAWQRRASIGYERRGNYAEAIKSIEAAIKVATASKDTALLKELNVRLPEMYRLSGRTEDAEKMRLKLATDDPANAAEHLFWYAMCFKNRNEFQKAADHFQEVYDKYPDNLMGQNALMEVYGCLIMVPGRKAEAEEAFGSLWDNHPAFRPEALFVKACVHLEYLSDPSGAYACLKRILRDYPGTPVARRTELEMLLASALNGMGRPNEAAARLLLLADAATGAERKAALTTYAAEVYQQAQHWEQARKTYMVVSDTSGAPEESRAHAMLEIAECQIAEHRLTSAEKYLRRTVELYPNTRARCRAEVLLRGLAKRDGVDLGVKSVGHE